MQPWLFMLLVLVFGHRHLHRHSYRADSEPLSTDFESGSSDYEDYLDQRLFVLETPPIDQNWMIFGLLLVLAGTVMVSIGIRLWLLEAETELRLHHPAYPPGYTPPLPPYFTPTELHAPK